MTENEYTSIKIPKKVYDDIERAVVLLYKELRVKNFPIDPWQIAKEKGFCVVPYSRLTPTIREEFLKLKLNGASYWNQDKKKYFIYYNDAPVIKFQRFTIMHEIGHILLEHKGESELANRMANYFAAYSLAPSLLIARYDCEDVVDLMDKFNISQQCADICFGRYLNWQRFGGELKDYEIELLDLTNWKFTQKESA